MPNPSVNEPDEFEKTRNELEAIRLRLAHSKERGRQLAANAEQQNATAQAESTARHEKREDFIKKRAKSDEKSDGSGKLQR